MKEYENEINTFWTRPDLAHEFGEIDRVAKEFSAGDDGVYQKIMLTFKNDFASSPLEPLTDEIWTVLENTESFHEVAPGDFDSVGKYSESKRDWQTIAQKMRGANNMHAPIIFEIKAKYHLVGGNTRLMVARALNARPWVIYIHYKDANP